MSEKVRNSDPHFVIIHILNQKTKQYFDLDHSLLLIVWGKKHKKIWRWKFLRPEPAKIEKRTV